ncbi:MULTISPECIES: hypothetical protein [unclassified Oceanobacter]|nr:MULTISPECIES: hypothetical protein [unclassified Oceanobacter]MDP2610027.1 hypothetical protein [Oceanobacter sp. 1_MG-2023]MDP2613337.1 hypothetical protein [Oceanobacter sp. 2_MG-2023]
MSEIASQYRVTILATGVKTLGLSPKYSHHQIAVEGATGDVTVKFRPVGFDDYQSVTDNVLEQNSSAVFVLGSVESVELTPTDTGVSYSLTVSSF